VSTSQHPRMPLLTFTTVLTVGLVVAGCGRSSSPAGGASSRAATGSPSSSASGTAAAGDFGTLKKVCGPGNPKGPTARGLTDSTIRIGVNSDAGAAAAPGIEQEFFDASEAFAKWCNAAGGINGRKIVIDKWDAKLFNVGQTTTAACQKDFMLVGGGNALDDAGVKLRLACKLGTIPAYTVTTAAANAGLQVKIQPGIATQGPFGAFRLLAQTYPDLKTKGIGVGSATLASLEAGGKKQKYALEHNGFKVTALQVKPVLVDNFRPYMEQLKSAGTAGLYETSGQDITPEIQAMKNVGWNPEAVIYSYQFYTAQAVQAAKALGTFPPVYVELSYLPFAAGVDTPATKEIKSQLSSTVSVPKYTQFTLESYDSWLLFATSATACGDNLTQACVLQKAASHTDWTAGGISPPVSTSPDAKQINDCVAIVRLTTSGWVFDKAVTQPNDGFFNCDPKNISTVPGNP
jgi:ABC-type branched-subunit amino acid transport system substrate-binding protein